MTQSQGPMCLEMSGAELSGLFPLSVKVTIAEILKKSQIVSYGSQ